MAVKKASKRQRKKGAVSVDFHVQIWMPPIRSVRGGYMITSTYIMINWGC
jgi:hypothetical protein